MYSTRAVPSLRVILYIRRVYVGTNPKRHSPAEVHGGAVISETDVIIEVPSYYYYSIIKYDTRYVRQTRCSRTNSSHVRGDQNTISSCQVQMPLFSELV
jgi:hypothetical protein